MRFTVGIRVSDVVDFYNRASGTWSTARLSGVRLYLGAASVGNVAIFAGGSDATGSSKIVDLYNSASGRWSTAQLSDSCGDNVATSVGNVAIFSCKGKCSFALCHGGLVLELLHGV